MNTDSPATPHGDPMTAKQATARFEPEFRAFADGLREIAPEYGIPKWLQNSDYRDEIMARAAGLVADVLAMLRLAEQAVRILDRASAVSRGDER